jgi:uncharacterized membrane protein
MSCIPLAVFFFIFALASLQIMLPTSYIFWMLALINSSANAAVAKLYVDALKSEEITLSVPLLNLTPVFLIFSAVLIAGEELTAIKVFGVLIIVIGAYFLHLGKGSPLQPFRSILYSKGSRYMVLIAFTWGITAAIDKVCIGFANPVAYGFIVFTLMSLFLTLGLIWSTKVSRKRSIVSRLRELEAKGLIILTSALLATMLMAQFTAISIGNVAYVIPIKRTGTIIIVLGGIYLFKERKSWGRMIGAITMIIGVFIIAFF